MTTPYSFTRRTDGPGRTIFAAHVNELQQGIEELGVKGGGVFVSGNSYSPASTFPGVGATNRAVTANRLYAVPFWTGPNGITMASLSIVVMSSAAGNARLGIYAADTEPPYYPAELLLDAGTVDTSTTGVKTIDIADTLYTGTSPSRLVWLASVFSHTPSVKSCIELAMVVGIDSEGNALAGVYMDHEYGALPETFDDPPATPTAGTLDAAPTIWTVAG